MVWVGSVGDGSTSPLTTEYTAEVKVFVATVEVTVLISLPVFGNQ